MNDLAELRDRIDLLTEQVAYWQAEAQRNATVDQIDRLRRAFGLTPVEAWVVGRLYGAAGRIVRADRLTEDLPGRYFDDRSEGSNIVQVLVCRIRHKAPQVGIETVRSHGYCLDEAGLAVCRAALGDAA